MTYVCTMTHISRFLIEQTCECLAHFACSPIIIIVIYLLQAHVEFVLLTYCLLKCIPHNSTRPVSALLYVCKWNSVIATLCSWMSHIHTYGHSYSVNLRLAKQNSGNKTSKSNSVSIFQWREAHPYCRILSGKWRKSGRSQAISSNFFFLSIAWKKLWKSLGD